MKYIFLLLLLMSPVTHSCEALKEAGLDFKQRLTLRHSFEYGRPYDLSYSLSAIAWKESSAGKYRINLQDPSAGIHMISISNAIHYSKRKDTSFNRNKLAQELIDSPNLSAGYAVINLQFWQRLYGNNWLKIYSGFNGGYSNSKASTDYAKDITKKIQIIKQCNWE